MKYYFITYTAKIRFSGKETCVSEAIDIDPIDYFIHLKEKQIKDEMSHYADFSLNFFGEISKDQYLKLKELQ